MSNVAQVESGSFAGEVLQANEPVVVDFAADWCQPCRMLAPVLDRVAQQYAGRVKVVTVDVDAQPELAQQYGAFKIPNLIFFKNGQVVDQAVGYLNEAQLAQKFEAVLQD